MAKHNHLIIIILVIIGLLIVGNNAKKEANTTVGVINYDPSPDFSGDISVIRLNVWVNQNNNAQFDFDIWHTGASINKKTLIEVQPMGSQAANAKLYLMPRESEACEQNTPFNRHTYVITNPGEKIYPLSVEIPTSDIISYLGPGIYSFRAISYTGCCAFETCAQTSPFYENQVEIARISYTQSTPQCTSGDCCNIGSQTYKPDGSQPTGKTDTYFCQGTNSPIGDSYVMQLDYSCDGQSATSHQQNRQVRTCDECDYCETGKSTCTHYSAGTSCGTDKTCDSQGYCGGPQTCSDGTVSGQCSTNKPLYCDGTSLINSCYGPDLITGNSDDCGCPQYQVCLEDTGLCANQFQCTGQVIPYSTLCTGDNTGLTANTQITAVTTCGTAKCEYKCDAGYKVEQNKCVPVNTTCLGTLNVAGLANQLTCTGNGLLWKCSSILDINTWELYNSNCTSGCNFNNIGSAVNTVQEACYGMFSCTGSAPANAQLCSGDDTGVTQNTPRNVVSSCTNTKCEYTCVSGYSKSGNSCVKTCSSDSDCTGTQKCVNSQCATVSEESQCMAFLQVCDPINTCKDSADNCTFNPILYWVIGGLAAMLLIKQMNKG